MKLSVSRSVCQHGRLSACQLVCHQSFSSMAHRIFPKFYMQLECLKVEKLTGPIFFRNSHFKEKTKKSSKIEFFWLLLKIESIFVFFYLKVVNKSILHDSAKTSYLGKSWFSIYDLKYSQPIRLQYSVIINTSGRNQLVP